MRLGRVLVCASIGALVSCSIREGDYTTELAVAECRLFERCALGYFEAEYRDLDDCVNEVGDDLDDVVDVLYDDCDYDDREAARCVDRVRGMSCEDWARGNDEKACDLVFDCTG